jgi:hypothetical protein
LSMNGVGGTLASSTTSRFEQFGQFVCTRRYLSIKLSISDPIIGAAPAPFVGLSG